MKKLLFSFLTVIAATGVAHAQYSEFGENAQESASKYTISSDNNILQIAGRVSGFYQYRPLKSGNVDKKNNNFFFKDVDLDFYGKASNKFVYEIQVSMVDLLTAAAVGNSIANTTAQAGSNTDPNPYNPGFKAVYFDYRGWPVHIKFGYDKIPYSQGSMSDVWSTPFWSHAELFGGDVFSRRDLGVTLNYRRWNNRLNFYAGAYSGVGENIFQYGLDASGRPEYIGRAEFCWPGKIKYHVIDHDISAKPTFRVAVNGRYTNKTQPTGHLINEDLPDAPGNRYHTRIFDGKKTIVGADMIFKYKGFSATFEAHRMNLKPTSQSDALYGGTPASFNNGVVKGGGIATGANYIVQKYKSVVSVNYENFNVNDLISGSEEWLYFGYAYKVGGFNSVLKAQYYVPMFGDSPQRQLKYTGQFRIGYQVIF
jgi:hypothetical protein